MRITLIAITILLFNYGTVSAQPVKPRIKNWHYLDFAKDGYHGISLNQAYELLKGRKSEPVIVAVIDSGIDTLQPDLKPVLWHNPREIPNNKKMMTATGWLMIIMAGITWARPTEKICR